MPFACALTTEPKSRAALDELCQRAAAALQGPADLAFLFYSAHHTRAGAELAAAAQERLGARCLLGCPGEAIVGDDREIEQGPAMSLWLARWDQPVTLTPFNLTLEQTSEGPDLLGWPDVLTGLDAQQAFI